MKSGILKNNKLKNGRPIFGRPKKRYFHWFLILLFYVISGLFISCKTCQCPAYTYSAPAQTSASGNQG